MSARAYVYIDGESHFIRSEKAWRDLHGGDASLDRLRYSDDPDGVLVLVLPKAKVFWTRKMSPGVQRAVYFTAASGDKPAIHDWSVTLREFGLEPHIEHERSDLAGRRQNTLRAKQLIEKPKGVDIALAVRMLEDAHRHNFEICHLYTSDVDFLPAIRAVMAHGKAVYVHGYRDGLSGESPLLHVPDLFVDLKEGLRTECQCAAPSGSAPRQ